MHVAGVTGEALPGFGHEAGGYAVFAADVLGDESVGEDGMSIRRNMKPLITGLRT